MATAGPSLPGTGASGGTGQAWVNPSNITADDATEATCTRYTPGDTAELQATNFGFAIPTGATIDGIEAVWERRADYNSTGNNTKDKVVKLLIGGVLSGDNKADTATRWPTSTASKTYGSSSDKWGLTPLYSDVNASNFGVIVQGTIVGSNVSRVDKATITITYTLAGYSHSVTGVAGASISTVISVATAAISTVSGV